MDAMDDGDLGTMDSDALRALVTDLRAENRALKLKLSDFENADKGASRTASKCAKCGSEPGKEDENAAVEVNGRILPNEIFLMIVKYLDSGSRTLLNLAKSCRTLYEILVPLLYESISMEHWSYKFKDTLEAGKHWPPSTLPVGPEFVKELILVPNHGSISWQDLDLVRSCKNVVELACSWDYFVKILRYGRVMEKLEILHVYTGLQTGKEIPAKWDCTPNLRLLNLKGNPTTKTMQFFGTHLPSSASMFVEFQVFDAWWDPWDSILLPESFLKRVTGWTFKDVDHHCELIEQRPEFAPYSLDFETSALNDQDYLVLLGLSSLHRLTFWNLFSHLLLDGLPPNLEELCIDSLWLTLENHAEIGELSLLLASIQPRVTFKIKHDARPLRSFGTHGQVRVYLAELAVWETVPGFESDTTVAELEHAVAEMSRDGTLPSDDVHQA